MLDDLPNTFIVFCIGETVTHDVDLPAVRIREIALLVDADATVLTGEEKDERVEGWPHIR